MISKQNNKSHRPHQKTQIMLSALYVACQTHEGDFDIFSNHKNQLNRHHCPTWGASIQVPSEISSLAPKTCMATTSNSSTLQHVSMEVDVAHAMIEVQNEDEFDIDEVDNLPEETKTVPEVPKVDVKILDGAAIVNMLKPRTQETFGDYAQKVFLPYIEGQLHTCERVDTVWDTYLSASLKAHIHSK